MNGALVDDLEICRGWLWNTGEASFRRLGWKKPLEQKETKRPNRDCGAFAGTRRCRPRFTALSDLDGILDLTLRF